MKQFKGFGTGLCVIVLCLLVAPKSNANPSNSNAQITFSGPVEVPGMGDQTLPAGTYTFQLLDSPADRHIVQVSSQDGSHVFATILAIPNSRLKTTGETTSTFHGRPNGEPAALKAWFYPSAGSGDQSVSGDQFVYERSKAIQLAKESNEAVPSTAAVLAIASIDVLKAAPLDAVNPNGQTVDIAQVMQAPPMAAPALVAVGGPTAPQEPAATAAPAVTADPAAATASATTATPTVTSDPAETTVSPATATTAVTVDPAATAAPVASAANTVSDAPSSEVAPDAVAAPPPTPTVDADSSVTSPAAPATTVAASDSSATTAPAATSTPTVAAESSSPTTPVASAEPATASEPTHEAKTLPQSGSFLPLIGLAGLFLLGGGFVLMGFSKLKA